MAETTTEVPPTSTNATVFTFEEQATSSLALYGMSILCIIIGSIRSAQYIKKNIEKKRLIEGSITMKEARKFPISASLVLFGLYIFFKPAAERFLWVARVAQTLRVPEQYVEKINSTIISYTSNSEVSTEPTEPFLMRLVSRIPRDRVPEQIQAAAIYVYSQLPTIEKTKCMELLTLLICFEGISAFASLLQPIITSLLKKIPLAPSYLQFNAPYLLSLKKGNKEMEEGDIEEAKKKETEYLVKIDFDRHYIIALLLCSPILISHLNKRHWITNNIIGISFSILGIERLHLASFKAGSLLLIGLFFYDIFWVFGTDVMTSVAKGIDAPILLQFPQDIYRNGVWEANKHSMLGLGDIVIPGIFIALLRRFDYRIGQATKEKSPLKGRYYFAVTVIAYMAGLFITMAVMHHFKAAQPALLYLVPCCLFVPLILAIVRGELSEIWNYDEGKHVDNEENRKRVDSSKKNN